MSHILSLETSTDYCSVALHHQGQLVGKLLHHEAGAHSRVLPELIQKVLDQSGVSFDDLKAVAVSEGPGSYTGLRIGASTAKAIAFALDLKLIAVNTLEALALQGRENCPGLPIVSMLDARRMEVYREVFSAIGDRVEAVDSEILDENSFRSLLRNSKVIFVGNSNEKASKVIKHPNALFLEIFPDASSVGQLAWEKYKKEQFESVAYFTPNYLKEFQILKSKKNPFLI